MGSEMCIRDRIRGGTLCCSDEYLLVVFVAKEASSRQACCIVFDGLRSDGVF